MIFTAVLVASCIISFVISLISGIIGVMAFIELRSFMKSTHKVQMVPMKVDSFVGNAENNTEDKQVDEDSYWS